MLYLHDKLRHSVFWRNPYEFSGDDAVLPPRLKPGSRRLDWDLSALYQGGLSMVVCRRLQ